MGNGHPLSAVVTTAELMEEFTSANMYFNTFAGNQVSCAAGMAVLDVLHDEGLLDNARAVGTNLVDRLRLLQKSCPNIGDVRGNGLFIGIDIVADTVHPVRPRRRWPVRSSTACVHRGSS